MKLGMMQKTSYKLFNSKQVKYLHDFNKFKVMLPDYSGLLDTSPQWAINILKRHKGLTACFLDKT